VDLQGLDFSAPRVDLAMPREADEFLLLREMHHRVANTLAVLAIVLRREFTKSISSEVRESFERHEARIIAVGDLHRSLVVGSSRDRISIQCHMERVCEALSEALLKPLGICCEVVSDAGEVPAERCERLGLVVAELVTNTAKHAFCGRAGGIVRVALAERAGFLVCVVSDNGVGAGVSTAGIGSNILDQLVRSIEGSLVVKSGRTGTSVIVTCKREISNSPGSRMFDVAVGS
jgi:two-component sensor histidine kinase